MDYYLNLLNTIGIHTLLGLSAYILILTGQVSLAQAGFFAIGAYTSALLTTSSPNPALFEDFKFGGDLPNRLGSFNAGIDLWFLIALIGAAISAGIMAALIGLFGNFTLPSDTVLAESSSHEKHHLTHVDSPLMTVLGLSGSDDGHSEEVASDSSGSLTITSGESGVEFAFAPANVEVSAGESVQLIFDNKGTIAHDFAIPELGFAIESTDAGQSGSATLAVPATPGTYDFICSIPGHKEAGMVGQIVIN